MKLNENDLGNMLSDAKGFLEAGEYLLKNIKNNGCRLMDYGPACTVNFVFACELYLKALILADEKAYDSCHTLKKLYASLSDQTQNKIKQEYFFKCKEYNENLSNKVELRSLDKCLEDYNNAFIKWRYWFEGERQPLSLVWIDLRILVYILRGMCLDVLKRTDISTGVSGTMN